MVMQNFMAKYGVAAAFMFLAFVGGWAIKDAADDTARMMRDDSVRSCQRVNIVRQTLADFLEQAAKARAAEGDNVTANLYRSERLALVHVPHPESSDWLASVTVDCERAFPKP